jgi:hypothetical protein
MSKLLGPNYYNMISWDHNIDERTYEQSKIQLSHSQNQPSQSHLSDVQLEI